MIVDINSELKLIDSDDRIANYLRGEMNDDEERQFVAELKTNNELRERAILQAKLIKAMRDVDHEVKNALRNSNVEDLKNKSSKTYTLPLKKWMAVAASIVIVCVIGFKSYDYYNVTNLGKEYASLLPMPTQVRGDVDEETIAELNALFKKVEIGKDLVSTITILEKLWRESNKDTYNKYTDYAPYIGWNLAIAYLRNYDKQKAKTVLEEMSEMYPDGNAMGDNVRGIITKF